MRTTVGSGREGWVPSSRRRFLRAIVAGLAVIGMWGAGLAPVTCDAAEFVWERDSGSVALAMGGRPVWRFRFGAGDEMPHFDIVGLPGGQSLVWASPPDHAWHHGLWFSWKQINGREVWAPRAKTGKEPCATTWGEVRVETRDDGAARLAMDLSYQPPGAEPVLTERRVIEVSAPGADGGTAIDWDMTFLARVPVAFERTPLPGEPGGKPNGGYGGMSARLAKDLAEPRVVNSEGLEGMATHGARALAMDTSGRLGGIEVGMALLDHPANPTSPSHWFVVLPGKIPFLYFNPAIVYPRVHRLGAGEEMRLRYRALIHPGRWDPARLREESRKYAGADAARGGRP